MSAIAIRVAAELRRRWRAWLGLALLVGLFGGIVLGAFAGARRTHTAYPRFLQSQNAYDMFLLDFTTDPMAADPSTAPVAIISRDVVATFPQVSRVIPLLFFPITDGSELIGSPDPSFDTTLNRPKVISGRAPDQTLPDEIALPVAVADGMHARLGGKLTLSFLRAPDGQGDPITFTFRVTGTIAAPGEFPPYSDLGQPSLHLTHAFVEQNLSRVVNSPAMLVRLKRGPADVDSFRRDIGARFEGKPVIGFTQKALTKNVERAFDLQATALWIVGLFLAIAAVLVIGQALSRQTALDGTDNPTLHGLGMTRSQLFGAAVARTTIVGIAGAILAAAIVVALSPLSPTGLARAAEPSPGFRFDGLIVGGGAVAVLAIVMVIGVFPAARVAKARQVGFGPAPELEGSGVSRLATWLSRADAPSSAVAGVRFALEPGRGATAVPVRSSVSGAALGLAALVMAFTFGGGLNHLLATPRLYGVTWDALADIPEGTATEASAREVLALVLGDPDVEAATPSGLGFPFLVDGVPADGMSLPVDADSFFPTILEGRRPAADDEVVLGTKTLKLIHKRVGDTVGVSATGVPPTTFRIVGRAALPTVGHTANLGEGSLLSVEGATRAFGGQENSVPNQFIARFKPGVDRVAARNRLEALLGERVDGIEPPPTPGDLVSFGRNQNLPFVLAGVLALLAAGAIAHVLLTGIARRRKDLALLKTLGFVRRQVGAAVAWQSTALVAFALMIAVPVGVATGRWLWNAYATQLGVIAVPVVPLRTVLLVIPAALLLANLISLAPARIAARTPAAVVLRAE